MIIELEPTLAENARERIENLLLTRYRTFREHNVNGRCFVSISGDRTEIQSDVIRSVPGVLNVSSNEETAFFARRHFSPSETTQVRLGDMIIGGKEFAVIAGPCAVEGVEELRKTAETVKWLGVCALRAGAFKPRTSPYNFQGLGMDGLRQLRDIGVELELPVVSEVLSPEDVEEADGLVDMFQVGTRNMTNQRLLKAIGRATKPVLLKRGFASPIEELVRAAEFIMYEGNSNVVFCERGIQTFEKATRFTLDISAIPVLRKHSHLPIMVDPGHAAGSKEFIESLALAAAAAGADGMLIEVHVDPTLMIKPGDDKQALLPSELEQLLGKMRHVLNAVGRTLPNVGSIQ